MEQERVDLLGYPEDFYEESVLAPVFFDDLNLDQIAAQIMAERKDYKLRRYFYRMPEGLSVTRRRQAVLRAFGTPRLFDAALCFSEHMQQARAYAADYRAAEKELQQEKLLLDCARQYVLAAEGLRDALLREREAAGDLPEILSAFAEKINTYVQSGKFRTFREETFELAEQFDNMAFRVEFANRKMRVVPEEERADYTEKLRALFPEGEASGNAARRLENPFQGQKETGELETFVLTVCRKKYPESFERLQKYEQKYSVLERGEENQGTERIKAGASPRTPGYAGGANAGGLTALRGRAAGFLEAWLLEAEQQLQVYLAVRLFMRRIEKTGYPLCFAEFDEAGQEGTGNGKGEEAYRMELRSCYDLALLLKQIYSGKPVVCNDAYYKGEERFLVVTGPNQGGKTTFARSIGQIVYFAKMGFAAPCGFAKMPYFTGLLTHFSVEESLETGRGKLKEELVRLEPMMHRKEGGSFVILNELFTTAATYDAYVMGKRVMAHFMAQECFGIYVTHIQELAEEEPCGGVTERAGTVPEREDAETTGFATGKKDAGRAGFAAGQKDAERAGFAAGREDAETTGFATGKKDAGRAGFAAGQKDAERAGFAAGREDAGRAGTVPEREDAETTGFAAGQGAGKIVSMAACVDERDAHIRTYRIVRRRAEGAGYAYGLVEKYRLTYPELKERLQRQLGGSGLCVGK